VSKALFLDRDGVINVDKEYLCRAEEFEFIDGIFDLCRHYRDKGYVIVVVTNQSGIARGYYSETDFEVLTRWMVGEFAKEGVTIEAVYHCPHHPDFSGACDCRKPMPGMLLQAASEHGIDLHASVLVGDGERDIEAARSAGLEACYLYDPSGKAASSKATRIVHSLRALV